MAQKKTMPAEEVPRIYSVRRMKVVLDVDLAKLYGVPPKRINEAVSRNRLRFPSDFCFQLTQQEFAILRSQIATLKVDETANGETHLATPTRGHGKHRKYLPRVFTEHGALMVATVLRSERAVQMSLYLVRAFVQMRDALHTNASILTRLAEIDRRLIEHDSVLREVVDRLQPLLDAPTVEDEEKPKIGFHPGNR
jgi:hypothetical protein